jgi:hypothetical protein
MKKILMLIGLAFVIAVGYRAYDSHTPIRDVPGKIVNDVVNFGKDAGRIISGEATQHGQEIGGFCSIGLDCKGYRGPARGGNTCCIGACATLRLDYTGVYSCPAACKSSPIARPGSC